MYLLISWHQHFYFKLHDLIESFIRLSRTSIDLCNSPICPQQTFCTTFQAKHNASGSRLLLSAIFHCTTPIHIILYRLLIKQTMSCNLFSFLLWVNDKQWISQEYINIFYKMWLCHFNVYLHSQLLEWIKII